MPNTNGELLEEIERLRLRLEEAEAVVEAIKNGIVDAVVVHSASAETVYTLEGADRPYRLLVEAMQQGVAVLNAEGVVLYCNPFLAALFQMSVQNVTGCTIDSFAAETDHAMLTGMLRNVENKSAHKEILLRHQDGTTFPAALATSVLPSQKFCLLISDLTQQQQYDEVIVSRAALADSEIRYRRLFESAKDGILILDTASGKITDTNPFMSELLGYSQDHFLGKELWEIGIFSDKAANEAAVRTLQDKGYIRYEHLPLETSGGLLVEVEVVANAYREDHHKVIQCNIRDITDRSRLEKETHEQASVLADLDRRKDEFLATLAHELRNPLAPIRNGLQIMKLAEGDGKVIERSRSMMERQVEQMTRLIDDLMDLSRISQGKIVLQKARLRLAMVVQHAVETSRPLIEQQGHELVLDVPDEPIHVDGDETRLCQVFANILNNAAKYTDRGGRIRLGVEQQGSEAVVVVEDNGVGIPAPMLPKVFEMFTQVDRSLEKSHGGLGIGLNIVERLVEMHGGTIGVESDGHGMGSRFTVRLPVVQAVTENTPDAATGEKATPAARRILVVDDNRDGADSLAEMLSIMGNETQTAHDGVQAVEGAVSFRPDVILMDIGMPKLNGYEACRRIREQAWGKNIVIVACTGWGQEDDKQKSQEAGFDLHMVKPVDPAALLKLLADPQSVGGGGSPQTVAAS